MTACLSIIVNVCITKLLLDRSQVDSARSIVRCERANAHNCRTFKEARRVKRKLWLYDAELFTLLLLCVNLYTKQGFISA